MDINEVKREIAEMRQLKQRVERSLNGSPEGRLWTRQARQSNRTQFYWIRKDGEKRTQRMYIPKKNHQLIRRLAQKEYDLRFLQEVKVIEDSLTHFLDHYAGHNLKMAFDTLQPAKRKMVTPYLLPDDQFVEKWKQEILKNPARNSYPIQNGYRTKNGEIVRSKSEMIFADRLYDHGIPYLYEPPMLLRDGKLVFPDFVILNVRTRQTIIIEIFGMMSNPEYAHHAVEKIKLYSKNGIFQGVSFFYFMETSQIGMDIDQMERLIELFLL